jgi:hypothetical protein
VASHRERTAPPDRPGKTRSQEHGTGRR